MKVTKWKDVVRKQLQPYEYFWYKGRVLQLLPKEEMCRGEQVPCECCYFGTRASCGSINCLHGVVVDRTEQFKGVTK